MWEEARLSWAVGRSKVFMLATEEAALMDSSMSVAAKSNCSPAEIMFKI